VDIHNYLMEKAPAYAERCCFTEMPLFSEPLPNGSVEGEGDESADLVSASTIIFQWYTPDKNSSLAKPVIDGFVLLGDGGTADGEAELAADDTDSGSYGTLAKVTIEVAAAREICAMFSSARRWLENASAAEAAGSPSDVVASGNIKARGGLARALTRAARVLRPGGAVVDAAILASESVEEDDERVLASSEQEDAAAEAAMRSYRDSLKESAAGGGEETAMLTGGLPVPCDDTTIRFLESCFDIDRGAHSEMHSAVCDWFRGTILL
jgi:hypothetical protein